jgi:GntR family transcriptional regulator, N-acetylglucosamine utilization regulator
MARYRLELGPIPLHHQVYLDLRSALDAGEWRPGDRLPPERELAARYGCSVITVRHALGELAREQRIERTRGRGTFVIVPRIERNIAGVMSFAEEMERRGLEPATRLVTSRIEPAGEVVGGMLNLATDAPVVYLERLRMAGGEPMILEQARLPAQRFPQLLAHDLERRSLYDLLAKRFATRVVRARETVEPVVLRGREARLLGLRPRALALRIDGIAFADDGAPVEAARSYVRGDRTRYYLEREVTRASWMDQPDLPLVAAAGVGGRGAGPAARKGGEEAGTRRHE